MSSVLSLSSRAMAPSLRSGQPTWEELRRVVKEKWDRQVEEMIRLLEQQLASQEQDARQPRLAMEADGPVNTKTRERTEGRHQCCSSDVWG